MSRIDDRLEQADKKFEEMNNGLHLENTELVEVIPVEETPFTIVRTGIEWHVTIGKYRLTKAMATREEAEADAERTDWNRLVQVIDVFTKIAFKNEETIKELTAKLKG